MITNWTSMAEYLTEELDIEELVVEALSRSELNLMAVSHGYRGEWCWNAVVW